MQLYLTRHGESTRNETGRVQGWGDPSLTVDHRATRIANLAG